MFSTRRKHTESHRLSLKFFTSTESRCCYSYIFLCAIQCFHLHSSLSASSTLNRLISIFSCRLNYDAVHKLEATRVLVTTEDIVVVSTTARFMAHVFLFLSTEQKGDQPSLREVLHDTAIFTRKAGSRPCRYCRVWFCCNAATKSSHINICRVILLAKCLEFTIHVAFAEF